MRVPGRFEEHECTFITWPCENTELDQNFDVIFGNSILHHLDSENAANSLHNLLNKNGRFLFLEPLGYNPLILPIILSALSFQFIFPSFLSIFFA